MPWLPPWVSFLAPPYIVSCTAILFLVASSYLSYILTTPSFPASSYQNHPVNWVSVLPSLTTISTVPMSWFVSRFLKWDIFWFIFNCKVVRWVTVLILWPCLWRCGRGYFRQWFGCHLGIRQVDTLLSWNLSVSRGVTYSWSSPWRSSTLIFFRLGRTWVICLMLAVIFWITLILYGSKWRIWCGDDKLTRLLRQDGIFMILIGISG